MSKKQQFHWKEYCPKPSTDLEDTGMDELEEVEIVPSHQEL